MWQLRYSPSKEKTINITVGKVYSFTSYTKKMLVVGIYAYTGSRQYVCHVFMHFSRIFTNISPRYKVFATELLGKNSEGKIKFGDLKVTTASKVNSEGENPPANYSKRLEKRMVGWDEDDVRKFTPWMYVYVCNV